MHRKILIGLAILTMAISVLTGNTSVEDQNMTNASNLTGIENTTTSASVTVKLNISTPEPESDDYPTPSPTVE